MSYPQDIIPQPNYKIINDNLDAFFICRTISDRELIKDFNGGIIPEELIDDLGLDKPSDFFDYSTNLPGIFKLEYNKIEIIGDKKKYYRTYWDPLSSVIIPSSEDFKINSLIGWLFLPIAKINKLSAPFSRNKDFEESATASVVHTPTNSNFWHFSIKWTDNNGKNINANNSAWKEKLMMIMRASLSQLIQLDDPKQDISNLKYK